MELKLLTEQYRQRSTFYAQEMARALSHPRHTTLCLALRIMQSEERPRAPREMRGKFAGLRRHGTTSKYPGDLSEYLLMRLAELGLLWVATRRGHSPFYTITDFGRLVVACLPETPETPQVDNPPATAKALPKRMRVVPDWQAIVPVILRLGHEGKSLKDIATLLGIKYGTLVAYCRRHHLRLGDTDDGDAQATAGTFCAQYG